MTVDFSGVTRSHILQALTEYDELGGEAFLDTHGFGPAGTHLVLHDGSSYDAEAILGAAQRYATGAAATSASSTGGPDGAARVLEELGFQVVPANPPRDAAQVGSATARAAWAEAARTVLLRAAGRYRALVTYTQLASAVQESSGITTTQLMHQWIGDVLGRVTEECQSRGEPLLSALCVSAQGSVGEGYADAVEHARGTRPTDPDDHAAHERLGCYRHWEADGLPRDGGTPLRTAHFKTVRKAAPSKAAPRTAAARKPAPRKTAKTSAAPVAAPPKPLALCPRCFTQVPASGVCDYCD